MAPRSPYYRQGHRERRVGLCSASERQFDVKSARGEPLTNVHTVTSPSTNKRAVIGAFLDLGKVVDSMDWTLDKGKHCLPAIFTSAC